MKILLLSQVFYPDVVAVAQYVAELGVHLSEEGHQVTTLCSARAYDQREREFPRSETWKGIQIRRVPTLNLGKKSKWRRLVNAASFFAMSFASLMTMPRQDVVVVVPPPPLLSVMAALFVKLRGGRLVYWNMDLNPDEAIAAGWLRAGSLAARFLESALRFSLHASASILVLDRFMKDRIVAKGIPAAKVHIVPVWTHDDDVYFDAAGRDAFRRRLGLQDKFVVMYSGNHTPLHPLDTMMQAALQMRDDPRIAFAFVGGGSEHQRVRQFAAEHGLTNILCEGYQPLSELSGSLSAADLQVVLLGDAFVGIVHPSKIYNMLAVGSPFLYIGPAASHIVDLQQLPQIASMGHFARHGEVDRVAGIIQSLAASSAARPGKPAQLDQFAGAALLPEMRRCIEAAAKQ